MAAKNPLGPTGLQVQRNVKRLREGQNLTLAELSRRLESIGRKIPTLGLARIENGERRVDADDLVALAAALVVSPATLLLPAKDTGQPVAIIQELSAPWQLAWRWACGEAPLRLRSDPYERSAQITEWQMKNQPHKEFRVELVDANEWLMGDHEEEESGDDGGSS